MSKISSLVRCNIATLIPYSTARDEYDGPLGIFLDANESPYQNGYNRYPDPHQAQLKDRLSQIKKVPARNIFIGNGSDEAIDLVYRVFCEPGRDNAVLMAPSYGMYGVAAAINDIGIRQVMLEEDFTLDTEKLLSACDSKTKVLFLCSPNNPSGNAFPKEQLLDICGRFPGIVVVDEAYADFSSAGSLTPDAVRLENLIVLQTLSKARAMAGLRIGLAISSEEIIRLMSIVKYPYNISRAATEKALQLLEKPIDVEVDTIIRERGRLASVLKSFPFVKKLFPSEANFLLVRVDDADALYDYLLEKGIIVRNRSRVRGCEGCLRITVGLPEENEAIINALKNYHA
ncbi:MAG: histidinol-phosphate transaminase [Bacteroidales bacterium]|nr:histidinol-phosphate transaminase [Bacteroidales bacterium]